MSLQKLESRFICGLDEAGRGPLAGPVCAAAVILPDAFPVEILNDSKKLSAARREAARLVICEKSIAWGVGWAAHGEIDTINILQASLLAMQRAFFAMTEGAGAWPCRITQETPLGRQPADGALPAGLTAIADGLYTPEIPVPCEALVKADAKIFSVMAASILAKTARDSLMEHYARLYPDYGYERHKGCPSRASCSRWALVG
jgi:ribonuclease HII